MTTKRNADGKAADIDKGTYTERYLAYCHAQRLDPGQTLSRDQALWPGGCMTGFIIWIGDRRQEFNRREGLPWEPAAYVAAFDAYCWAVAKGEL